MIKCMMKENFRGSSRHTAMSFGGYRILKGDFIDVYTPYRKHLQ